VALVKEPAQCYNPSDKRDFYMKIYELMVIFDGSLDEEAYKAAVENVEKTIKTKGGTVTALDEWGKRRMVYAIKHQDFGYYAVYRLTAEKTTVPADIQSTLKIQDAILRSMITLAKTKKAAAPSKKAAAVAE
jgi:small subunit ribosomal protein S6